MKKLVNEILPGKYQTPPIVRVLLTAWFVAVVLLSVAIVATTLAGIYNGWRVLPILDMWNGEIPSILAIQNGQISEWWAQHNEHRLLFPRFFFWVDIFLFGATGVFLALSIVLVMTLIVVAFYRASMVVIRQSKSDIKPAAGIVVAMAVIIALNFSWLQYENFLWGFQIQFVLATLLPLVSLLSLERSTNFRLDDAFKSWAYLLLAIGASTAALLTMASGITAPWILAALGVFLSQPLWRKIFLVVYAAVASALYLVGYKTPEYHANPLESLKQPLAVLRFVLHYFGGPFDALTKSSKVGLVFGSIILLLIVFTIFFAWFRKKRTPMGLALAAFLVGVLANAILVALGRINFGVEPTSRYFTPVFSAISALIVFYLPEIQKLFSKRIFIPVIAGSLAILFLTAGQYSSFKKNREVTALQDGLASIALSLGAADYDVLGPSSTWPFIYPAPEYAIDLAQHFKAAGVTVIGRAPYRDMAESLGTGSVVSTNNACAVTVASSAAVGQTTFNKVSGNVTGAQLPRQGQALPFVNAQHQVVGYAVFGFEDVANSSNHNKFVGYVSGKYSQVGLSLVTDSGICGVTTK